MITGLTFEEATPEALGLNVEDVNSLSSAVPTNLKEKDNGNKKDDNNSSKQNKGGSGHNF